MYDNFSSFTSNLETLLRHHNFIILFSNAPVVTIAGKSSLLKTTKDGLALQAAAYVSQCDNTRKIH